MLNIVIMLSQTQDDQYQTVLSLIRKSFQVHLLLSKFCLSFIRAPLDYVDGVTQYQS